MLQYLPIAQVTPWFTPLVWMDYRLAVLFAVIVPLLLLIWAVAQNSPAIQHLLTIYWRVSSLLMITVYLMIAAAPISFLTAFLARILIPVSLWFWEDLNEELSEQSPSPLKFSFNIWRWLITIYSGIGIVAQAIFIPCAFKSQQFILNDDSCHVWLNAPWGYKELFHAGWTTQRLGILGFLALLIYVVYFCHFVMVRLGRQGRIASR